MINAEPSGPAQAQQIAGDDDVVRVRQLVRAAAVATKLSLVDQTKLVTAASELARNTLDLRRRRPGRGAAGDQRPAQRHPDRRSSTRAPASPTSIGRFTDGYSTGGGLGLGLSGARRLMDEFELVHRGRRGHDRDRRQVGAVTMTRRPTSRVRTVEPRP